MLGLPLHPLVVHLAVVLIPLSSAFLLLAAWREEWRRRFGGVVAALALLAAATSVLAVRSGDELKHEVLRASAEAGVSAKFGDHPDFGRATQITAVASGLGATAIWLTARPNLRSRLPRFWLGASYIVVAIPAVAAVVAVGLAGHSGAALVWRDLGSFPAAKVLALDNQRTGPSPAPTIAAPPGAVIVRMLEFRYDPPRVEVSAGAEVVFYVVNEGKVFHTLTMLEPRTDTRPLWPGSASTLSFAAPGRAGTYIFLCTEEGHEEEGMIGELIVR